MTTWNKDGGPVAGTGGGKFGASMRWKRPDNARPEFEVYATTIVVWGVGESLHRRRSLHLAMIVANKDGWQWSTTAGGAVRQIQGRSGKAADLASAQAAAVAAARELVGEAASHPRESDQHPPVGPAVWPGLAK